MTETWNCYKRAWEEKRNKILCNNVTFNDIINLPYNWGKQNDREHEMLNLRCTEYYRVPSAINEPTVPVLVCKYSSKPSFSDIVAAADENGWVYLFNIKRLVEPKARVRTHENAVFDLAWVPNDTKFLTLSGDHSAKLWDCGEGEVRLISSFCGHNKSIKTADFSPSDPATFVTGSRDGTVMVWDSRCQNKAAENVYKPDQVILRAAAECSKKNKRGPITSVTAVIFQDSQNLVSCGSGDAYVRVWDMRKTYSTSKISEPKTKYRGRKSGFSDLKLNPERTKLYASCINSSICCFNLNSSDANPIAEFIGHEPSTFYVKICVSEDGRYLISGSSDKFAYVWKTRGAELYGRPCDPYLYLESHIAEVTGVDIRQGGPTSLITCSDDGSLRKWQPIFLNQEDNACNPIDVTKAFSSLHLYKSEDLSSNVASCVTKEADKAETETDNEKITPVTFKGSLTASTPPAKISSSFSSGSKRKLAHTSPRKSSSAKRLAMSQVEYNLESEIYTSPTMNLPNYVIDGTGPYHRCSRSTHKENVDWLTKMRKTGSTSKSSERDRSQSRTSERAQTEGRSGKCVSRMSDEAKKTTSRRTLLEYYKKSSKGCDDPSQKNS